MTDRSDEAHDAPAGLGRPVMIPVGLGLAAMLLAAILLWATEGGQVFAQSAFAALAACL